jgi:hypothetical protein
MVVLPPFSAALEAFREGLARQRLAAGSAGV